MDAHHPGIHVAASPPLARGRARNPGPQRRKSIALALVVALLVTGGVAWDLSVRSTASDVGGARYVLPIIGSLEWTPSNLTLNNTTTGVVVASGGPAPYQYAWSGLPSPCGSNDTAVLVCTPGEVGTYNVTVTVTDASGSASDTSVLRVLPSPGGATPQRPPGEDVKLSTGGLIDSAGASFFGVVAQTNCYNCIEGGDGAYLNQTPFRDIRYGQGGESCDVVNDTFYQDGKVDGACPFSIPALKQWCYSTDPHCEWYVGLPAEINSPSYAGYEANWLVNTLHFTPTYWSIGNEPESYANWNCAWNKWATCTGTPTAGQWASEVLAYAKAIRAVAPNAKIIGIQAVGWYSTFIPKLAASPAAKYLYAIAFHDYPPPTVTGTAAYLSLLDSQYSATREIDEVRSIITAANSSLANLPIFIGEFNGGPCPIPSPLDQEFPNVLLFMGTVVQALRANLAELDYFALANDGFSLVGTNYVPNPTGVWMKEMKSVRMGDAYNISISGNVANVWSVEWVDGTSDTVMVVNANTVDQLSLSVGSSFAVGSSGHTVFWDGSGKGPTVSATTLTQFYAVPPDSILLIENY
jgi:Cellulase (glycosyl hydrolase family 5)